MKPKPEFVKNRNKKGSKCGYLNANFDILDLSEPSILILYNWVSICLSLIMYKVFMCQGNVQIHSVLSLSHKDIAGEVGNFAPK